MTDCRGNPQVVRSLEASDSSVNMELSRDSLGTLREVLTLRSRPPVLTMDRRDVVVRFKLFVELEHASLGGLETDLGSSSAQANRVQDGISLTLA